MINKWVKAKLTRVCPSLIELLQDGAAMENKRRKIGHVKSAIATCLCKPGDMEGANFSEFYVVCPSNTPVPKGLPANKTNEFVIHLPKPIDTSRVQEEIGTGGAVEVALVEISFPHSWVVPFPANRCRFEVAVADISRPHDLPVRMKSSLPPRKPEQDYGTVQELIAGLNERRPRMDTIPNKIWAGRFLLSARGHVQIVLFEGEAIELDPSLAEVLGFEEAVFHFSKGEVSNRKGPFSEDKYAAKGSGKRKRPRLQHNASKRAGDEDPEESPVAQSMTMPDRAKASPDPPTDSEVESEGPATTTVPSVEVEEGKGVERRRLRRSSTRGERKKTRQEEAAGSSLIALQPLRLAKRFVFTAKRAPDLDYNAYNIFVYSSIVKSSPVGNVYTPLLRSIPVDPRDRGRYLSRTFVRPRYLPLNGNYFRQIDFQLRHETGKPVRFRHGKVICTLHFRRRRQR